MGFPSINIVKHALSIYIVEAFLMFEKEFIDGVAYNYKEVESSTCDKSFEVVLHAYCVKQVLDQYIIKRWCKGIKDGQSIDSGKSSGKDSMMHKMRKMNLLITASQMNKNARAHCEKVTVPTFNLPSTSPHIQYLSDGIFVNLYISGKLTMLVHRVSKYCSLYSTKALGRRLGGSERE
ncbi:hypothetical protein Cgig2_008760 [Carnegiea gigantea]|uniref:Uncharacterized protein n=1 Tax=Carnegiea gigantea TaxID=171969 RepID=A0A9Q1K686_9CARY|nr:hypothetical protein Cgig2_008760 [Carnegiea gigantea]